jgi:alpha-N-arabinofuranosidase
MGKPVLKFSATSDVSSAVVRILPGETDVPRIPKYITGKFCEHLGHNIYNGMHAEILKNPTFGDFPFGGGGQHPDGGVKFQCDEKLIEEQIKAQADRFGFPEPDRLVESRQDGLAHFWIKEGPRESVRVSPDAAPNGDRAQRVEAGARGQGIAQWTYLPLHRVRRFDWRIVARSNDIKSLDIALYARGADSPVVTAAIRGLGRAWKTFTGRLVLPAGAPADAPYRFVISAPTKGQFVISRALLYPADHVHGADPDVIRFLKESRLPLLRWPGGNFVSGYHWKDGVGPVDMRPTRPNPAWGGLEYNLFGTDEFVQFCRDVGCEPMICLNAGNGTPEEARQWVEYCNGSAKTPMGRLRAANGHVKPFNIRYWEIGNELTGRHQVGWTTSAGYSDRYREFVEAMRKADPRILFLACGAPMWWKDDWNKRLCTENARIMRCLTDHILVGGRIAPSTDPLDVYRDFMVFPWYYQSIYDNLKKDMQKAGVKKPLLAITELQLFGRIDAPKEGETPRLTHENLVNPGTLAEALYDVLYYHMAIRLGDFVELFTHSATVNHGGGLRKDRERVYANPCHYGQAMFAAFHEARPAPVEIECAETESGGVLGHLPKGVKAPVIDAVAGIAADGALLVSLVHRGLGSPVAITVDAGAYAKTAKAVITRLTASVPWAANTLEKPTAVTPVSESISLKNGILTLDVPPYTLMTLRIPRARR